MRQGFFAGLRLACGGAPNVTNESAVFPHADDAQHAHACDFDISEICVDSDIHQFGIACAPRNEHRRLR